jgi:endoribonuclease Dicer
VRPYQEKLYAECLNRNSLIYLPTGSGKTFIALKVINHFEKQLNTPLEEGGKRAVFLVNTVCLAEQHKETIEEILGLKVACWTSETKKKTWNKTKYVDEFESNHIVVATAQLFLDAVKHSFLSISQINVLIFDECHHGDNNHPYHELMKQFQYVGTQHHPRIIGLSGMLIGISSSITPETVEEKLKVISVRKFFQN